MTPTVAAIGFSCRSLLETLKRIGLSVVAVDHFGDKDTCELADAVLTLSWLAGTENRDRSQTVAAIVRWLQSVASTGGFSRNFPVFLAGGTENWPELLNELHAHYAVIGPTRSQIGMLRDLEFWRGIAQQANIGFPETVRWSENLHLIPNRQWLCKPLSGSGGVDIHRTKSGKPAIAATRFNNSGGQSKDHQQAGLTYLQREIHGRSLGVTWMPSKKTTAGQTSILGATESLSARDWSGPTEFIYRGSLGPVELSSQQIHQLQRLGEYVVSQTGLNGWFQADFIEDDSGQLWLLELNPRWTAGMEVLRLTNPTIFHQHIRAAINHSFRPAVKLARFSGDSDRESSRYAAKAIVYAQQDFLLTEQRLQFIWSLPRESFADLPSRHLLGQSVPAGSPLLTVRTTLETEETQCARWPSVRQRLLLDLSRLRRQFEQNPVLTNKTQS